jgi:hypothetical protein
MTTVPADRLRRRAQVARALVCVGWGACLLATVLIFVVRVTTVLFTGPLIAALGALTILFGRWARYPGAVAMGAANVGICVVFVALVNQLRWSPRDATGPFEGMGTVYTAISGAWAVWVCRRMPVARNPGECAACGYPLFGLPGPRCPECGRAFDPSEVPDAPPVIGAALDPVD